MTLDAVVVLPDVGHRGDVERRKVLGSEVVDVAEVHEVVTAQRAVLNAKLHVPLVLAGAGGDADDAVGMLAPLVGQPDVVVAAGAEMKDGEPTIAGLVEIDIGGDITIGRTIADVVVDLVVADHAAFAAVRCPCRGIERCRGASARDVGGERSQVPR